MASYLRITGSNFSINDESSIKIIAVSLVNFGQSPTYSITSGHQSSPFHLGKSESSIVLTLTVVSGDSSPKKYLSIALCLSLMIVLISSSDKIFNPSTNASHAASWLRLFLMYCAYNSLFIFPCLLFGFFKFFSRHKS